MTKIARPIGYPLSPGLALDHHEASGLVTYANEFLNARTERLDDRLKNEKIANNLG